MTDLGKKSNKYQGKEKKSVGQQVKSKAKGVYSKG